MCVVGYIVGSTDTNVGYIVGSTDTNTEQLELLNVNVTINMTGGYEEPESTTNQKEVEPL